MRETSYHTIGGRGLSREERLKKVVEVDVVHIISQKVGT